MLSLIFGISRLSIGIFFLFFTWKRRDKVSNGLFNNFTFRIIVSIFLILSGFYSIVKGQLEIKRMKENSWTSEDRNILIGKCISEVNEKNEKLFEATQKYCSCSVDSIVSNIDKNRYIATMQKSKEEKIKQQYRYFRSCLEELQIERKRLSE